jgi:hypothetical protein
MTLSSFTLGLTCVLLLVGVSSTELSNLTGMMERLDAKDGKDGVDGFTTKVDSKDDLETVMNTCKN